ncbi:MAG: DUF2141 domain-containing protein [Deltaproteobacteria bacterium]
MKKLIFAAFALCVAAPAFAAEITVTVEGVKSQKGKIRCGLYVNGDGFPSDKAKVGKLVAPKGASVQCVFSDVAPGTYAIAVMHDENGNGKMDSSWVGAPQEPWGVSKNAPAHTFGPPKFDEAKFAVAKEPVTLRIRLNAP